MIAAIGLGFLGILLSVLGMKCTSVGASNHKAKARTALLGGLMLGVAGKSPFKTFGE
jgi:claudin